MPRGTGGKGLVRPEGRLGYAVMRRRFGSWWWKKVVVPRLCLLRRRCVVTAKG